VTAAVSASAAFMRFQVPGMHPHDLMLEIRQVDGAAAAPAATVTR
jgi:hypothetical protein